MPKGRGFLLAFCDENSFEMVEDSPSGSAFKIMLVQCSSCGAVVGVMDYYNIGAKLDELEKKIDRLR